MTLEKKKQHLHKLLIRSHEIFNSWECYVYFVAPDYYFVQTDSYFVQTNWYFKGTN